VYSWEGRFYLTAAKTFLLVTPGLSILNPHRKNFIAALFYTTAEIHNPVNIAYQFTAFDNFAVNYY
jgi:hypothetical protein